MALDDGDLTKISELLATNNEEQRKVTNETVRKMSASMIKDNRAGFLGDIPDQLQALTEGLSAMTESKKGDDKSKSKKDTPSEEVARLQTELGLLKAKDLERDQAAKDATKKASAATRRQVFMEAAGELNMTSPAIAFSHLEDRLVLEEDGESVHVDVEREAGYTDPLSVVEFLQKEFLPNDGKVFAPPVPGRGTGGRRGESRDVSGQGSDTDKARTILAGVL